MNKIDERNQEVKDFLKQIEEKLPGWLKDNKEDLRSVKEELEEHIWDKAEDLAMKDGTEPNVIHVRTAIAQMGSPRSIVKEYKKRGTPKIYITEELYPFYIKGLKIMMSVIIAINFIGLVFDLIDGNFWGIGEFFSGIVTGAVWGIFFVSLFAVIFSMEGYLPQDFKDMAEEEKRKEQRGKKGKGKVKPPLKVGEVLSDAIFSMIFGVFGIIMPVEALNTWLGPTMVSYIQITSILTLIQGIITLFQSLAGVRAINTQRFFIVLKPFIALFFIPVYLTFHESIMTVPAIINAPVFDILNTVFKVLQYIIIFALFVDLFENISKAAKYQSKFEEYEAYKERNL